MARINQAALAMQATDFAYRAGVVYRDPAVQKSAVQAGKDIRQALKSTSELGREARSAWRRA